MRFLSLIIMFFGLCTHAQVGIGTTTPQATLDVQGEAATASALDGIIPPRLTGDQLSDKTYTSSQTGAVVYITSPDSTPSGQTVNVNSSGFYFFDGSEWVNISTGDVDKSEDAFVNNTSDSRIELETLSDGSSARPTGTEFVVQDDGNVGIGTATPSESLEIDGSLYSQIQIPTGNYTGIVSGLNALGSGNNATIVYNSSTASAGVGTELSFLAITENDAVLSYTEDVSESTSTFRSSSINANVNAAELSAKNENTSTTARLDVSTNNGITLNSYIQPSAVIDDLTEISWASPTDPIRFYYVNSGIISSYSFPRTDGTSNQVLSTDGSGTLSWNNAYWFNSPSNSRIEVRTESDGITSRSSGSEVVIKDSGNVGIGETNPSSKLHLHSTGGFDQLRLETPFTPVSTSDPNGNVGDVAWDDDFIYIKTSTGWKRSALSTF